MTSLNIHDVTGVRVSGSRELGLGNIVRHVTITQAGGSTLTINLFSEIGERGHPTSITFTFENDPTHKETTP